MTGSTGHPLRKKVNETNATIGSGVPSCELRQGGMVMANVVARGSPVLPQDIHALDGFDKRLLVWQDEKRKRKPNKRVLPSPINLTISPTSPTPPPPPPPLRSEIAHPFLSFLSLRHSFPPSRALIALLGRLLTCIGQPTSIPIHIPSTAIRQEERASQRAPKQPVC